MLLSELINKNLLLVTDDAYKLKESIIIDETEAEIKIEVLNSLDSENEVPSIPDTQAMMTPQLLDSPQSHTSSRQYQQLETTSLSYTKTNWNSRSCWNNFTYNKQASLTIKNQPYFSS